MRVSITELASATVTRGRGKEAFANLARCLKGAIRSQGAERVEIEIPSGAPVSLSFLDELVLQLMEKHQLNRVAFSSGDNDTRLKLSRIAAIRGVDLTTVDQASGRLALIRPRYPKQRRVEFVESKRSRAS